MYKRILSLGLAAAVLSVGLMGYSEASGVASSIELSAVKKEVVRKNVVRRNVVVRKNTVVKRAGPVRRNVVIVRRPYRVWAARPYYGTVFAGVALGTVIAVSAAHAYPPPPDPNACWFWSDPEELHGYWDYCTPP